MTTPNVHWLTDAILDALGTPEQVREACARRGFAAPEAATVKMWRRRGSIPGPWMPTMLALLNKAPKKYVELPDNPF